MFYKLECYEEYFLSLSSSVNLDQTRESVYRRNPDLRPSPWSSEIKQIEILFQSNNSFILYLTHLNIYKKIYYSPTIHVQVTPYLSIAPSVSKGVSTNISLVTLSVNVAPEKAEVTFRLLGKTQTGNAQMYCASSK